MFDGQLATVGFSEQKSQCLLPITHISSSIDAMFDRRLATVGSSEQKSQSLLPITHISSSVDAIVDYRRLILFLYVIYNLISKHSVDLHIKSVRHHLRSSCLCSVRSVKLQALFKPNK